MTSSTTELFLEVAGKHQPHRIAALLGLHPNTVMRWVDKGRAPGQYHGDFMRMLGQDGNTASSGNEARDKDQFYTKPEVAEHCYHRFHSVAENLNIDLSGYRMIEPAAGCGNFYRLLPPRRRIGIDLAPREGTLIQADYLRWSPGSGSGKFIVIGNPPFGLRGHLALQFINHSANFADMVAFILPQLFDSDGKGVPAKRVHRRYRLAYAERLAPDSFEKPDGSAVDISTVFQVWTAVNRDRIRITPKKTCSTYIQVYSLSDGGTPASTRNKHMLGKCDLYLPSTCFRGMKPYCSFAELPNKRGYGIVYLKAKRKIQNLLLRNDWEKTAFRSTNGALNLRRSLIEDVLTSGGCYDQ